MAPAMKQAGGKKRSAYDDALFTVFGDERLSQPPPGSGFEAVPPPASSILPAPLAPPAQDRLIHFVAELHAAPSAEQRRGLVRATLDAIGFDWVCYMRFFRVGELINRALYYSAYAPPGWPRQYLAKRYFEIDPRLSFAYRYEWPLVWDLDSLFERSTTNVARERSRDFLDDARAAGLASGVTFGVTSTPRSLDHRVISFGSSNPKHSWIADHVVGQAYAVGIGLHEFLAQRADLLGLHTHATSLSEVQRQILQLLTDGLSDFDIAQRLGMSVHNVDYHLRQLKEKYGAHNRVQLAYIAGRLASP